MMRANEMQREFFEMCGCSHGNDLSMTNVLTRMAFSAVGAALEEHGIDEGRIDWYVDGMCSSFVIDGEEA